MQRSLYLINPRESGPGFYSAEVLEAWGIGKTAGLADLATPTVAALVPSDWTVSICDERVQRVDFGTPAKVIGLTGKVSQRDRIVELAQEFRSRGKLVLIGGPYASLNPDDLQPYADVLVAGEIEEIAKTVFDDIAAGRQHSRYEGTRPDLSLSPLPRWDLYPSGIATVAQVQTSRGCPFECEFCDVIQYLGRKQRWKDPEQVVRELDVLYRMGFRRTFFADDNFTVMRRRTYALLERVAAWNAIQPSGIMRFATQASIDLARDPDLLDLCVKAGLRRVFIGVETPNQESLAETLKRQNLRIDLVAEISKIAAAGLVVNCGLIVGFDHDGPDIFERQAAFIDRLPVPLISFGLLVAPAATPLHARMKAEGRLISHARVGAHEFIATNIRPKLMSEDQLKGGARWLLNRIYAPEAFGGRLRAFANLCRRPETHAGRHFFGDVEVRLALKLAQKGRAERELLRLFEDLREKRPDLGYELGGMLLFYCQVRHMLDHYGIWDPTLSRQDAPLAA